MIKKQILNKVFNKAVNRFKRSQNALKTFLDKVSIVSKNEWERTENAKRNLKSLRRALMRLKTFEMQKIFDESFNLYSLLYVNTLDLY